MIREATADDIEHIVELGREFHAEAPILGGFVADDFRQSLRSWLGEAIILVAPDGFMIGFLHPAYFNFEVKIAHELLWYVRKDCRTGTGRQLLKRFEQVAKERGATRWVMTASEWTRIDAVSALYRRMGFSPLERCFSKEI